MWKHFQYIAGTMSSLQRRWVQFRIRLQREVFLLSIISTRVWSVGLFTLQGLGSTDLPALWGHWSHDLLHTSHHYMVFYIKKFNWARINNILTVYLFFIWLRTIRITEFNFAFLLPYVKQTRSGFSEAESIKSVWLEGNWETLNKERAVAPLKITI